MTSLLIQSSIACNMCANVRMCDSEIVLRKSFLLPPLHRSSSLLTPRAYYYLSVSRHPDQRGTYWLLARCEHVELKLHRYQVLEEIARLSDKSLSGDGTRQVNVVD